MEMNKKVVLKVAVLLFLLGLTATVDARSNPGTFAKLITKGDASNYFVKSTTTACCDDCVCTKSNPPICRCADRGDTCHSACNFCICVHEFWPLRLVCNCADENSFCYPPCTSSGGAELPEAHKE